MPGSVAGSVGCAFHRRAARGLVVLLLATLTACGGGGGSDGAPAPGGGADPPLALRVRDPAIAQVAPAPNVLPVRLTRGVRGNAFNTPFVSVTLCVPGTATCHTIDQVLLDTGSTGLRIAASALPSPFALPPVTTEDGAPVAQCLQFASGNSWGPVRRADVRLGGETAEAIPIQVVDDHAEANPLRPAACPSATALGSVLDANGVLGVGLRRHDCGAACEQATPPAIYFACDQDSCAPTALPRASQVGHPVAALAANHNGVTVVLPPVPPGGTGTIIGALILGIGTQPNNLPGAARVSVPDAAGFLTTTYKGAAYRSLLDTGTNSLRFPDAELPACGSFYCPPQPVALSAAIAGADGSARAIDFMLDTPYWLQPDAVGAPIGGGRTSRLVIWGLPFFFGRTVHVAIEDADTPAGPGPYWAF